jgi:SSS family solute:Na+ symporter/sodium/pantothenate symporter
VFLIALHWRGFRAGPALVGLVSGTAIALLGVYSEEFKRIGGIHIGVIGLVVNAALACLGSLWTPSRR